MSKTNNALALVSQPEFAVAKDGLAKLKEAAVLQASAISELESKAALGAIIAGLTFHRVKASLNHGEFGPWIAQISTSGGNLNIKKSQANHYMRLAMVFLEKAKVQKPDLLALPGDQMALEVGDGHPARQFFTKAQKFVGDLSLNELLIKHGIKGVGLKTELAQGAEDDEAQTPEQKAAVARERAWAETFESVQRIRANLTETARMHLLTDPKHIEILKSELVEVSKLLDDRLANLRAVNA
jgi:hypothetical protein